MGCCDSREKDRNKVKTKENLISLPQQAIKEENLKNDSLVIQESNCIPNAKIQFDTFSNDIILNLDDKNPELFVRKP